MATQQIRKKEPPYEKKGSGMPVIGIRLTVIPTFSKTCVKNRARMPNTTRLAKGSVARRAIRQHDQEQREEEPQRHQHAEEPEFLPHHGEDEVGVLRREEGEPLLRALREPVAEPAAGADRHPGLDRVVPGGPGVDLGIEECEEPVLLVGREPLPERHGQRAHDRVGDVQQDALARRTAARSPAGTARRIIQTPQVQVLNASSRLSPGQASMKSSDGLTPAQNSIRNRMPMKTMALPRSGCLSTRRKRHPGDQAGRHQLAQVSGRLAQAGEVARQHQDRRRAWPVRPAGRSGARRSRASSWCRRRSPRPVPTTSTMRSRMIAKT